MDGSGPNGRDGYTGGGGKDYMVGEGTGKNCIIVDTGDYYMMARALEEVLRNWSNDASYYDDMIHNALKTAENFLDVEAEKIYIQNFFQNLTQ